MKILVRATNWIGDAVMSLPAIRAIHERYPRAGITVLAKPWVAALYEGERAIERIVPLDAGAMKLGLRLRKESYRGDRFDLAVLLPNSLNSAFGVWIGGAKRIVGYARDGRSPLLSDAIAVPVHGEIPPHESYYYLELLRRAGLLDSLGEVREIRLDDIEGKRRRGVALFESLGAPLPVIGVSPGAAYGNAKRWLPERFAESARWLARQMKASIAVFGSAAERSLCEDVSRAAGGINLAGKTTLREFIDMTAACSLFLTNDSGAMHIASASGVPSVTVFGPTNEVATGPMGELARIVREPVDCAPCLLRECPIDHRCMTRVTADHVISAASSAIATEKDAAESRMSQSKLVD